MEHVGLPLAIHSIVRDKNLVDNLSEVYIGSDYRRILDLEKRVEQAFIQRKKETGGVCLPDFVKKGKNIWFAIDNIDTNQLRANPSKTQVCALQKKEPRIQTRTECGVERYQTLKHNNTSVSGHPP